MKRFNPFIRAVRALLPASLLLALAIWGALSSLRPASGQQPPVTLVSAATFQAPVAGDSIVAAFGAGLATQTAAAATLPLPTSLAGTTVRINGALAPLFFVAPSQVNCLIPSETAAGTANVTVTSGDGTVSNGTVQIAPIATGLFTFNATGQGLVAGFALRVRASGARVNEPIADCSQNPCVPIPIDLTLSSEEVFLIMFGTGLRGHSGLPGVRATIGGENAEVLYAGLQGDLAGLDQVNLRLPRSLRGRGLVNIALTVGGQQANTVQVAIR